MTDWPDGPTNDQHDRQRGHRGHDHLDRVQALLTPCLLWEGPVNNRGYGLRRSGRARWGTDYVHRQEWMKATGTPLGRDEVVMHRCDTPACYRLDHLQLGTQRANMADAARKGRIRNQNTDITECKRGHPFSDENTYVDPTGRRHCRTCGRDWMNQHRRDEGIPQRGPYRARC